MGQILKDIRGNNILLSNMKTLLPYISNRPHLIETDLRHGVCTFYPFLPTLALVISIYLLVPVGGAGFFSGLIWLSIGFAIYFIRTKSIQETKKIITNENKVNLSSAKRY